MFRRGSRSRILPVGNIRVGVMNVTRITQWNDFTLDHSVWNGESAFNRADGIN